jgi:serine phosphatase RsbU (regulator of sigma subunit)
MATVVYALVAPDRQTAMVSVAGHPPPVLATPSRPARLIDAPADPLLGTGAQFDRRDTVVRVPVGGLLVFYTDGLVERRNRSIREGLARLVQAVEAGPVEDVAARIMTLMDIDRVSDDIALLTVHRTS